MLQLENNILLEYILYRIQLLEKYKNYLLQQKKELDQVIDDVTNELEILTNWKDEMF